MKEGVVFIDGKELDHPGFEIIQSQETHPAVTIPAGEYYLLGDNRPDSEDSRFIGTVKSSDVVGIAGTIIRKADYDAGKRW